jgi:hypothetical protein
VHHRLALAKGSTLSQAPNQRAKGIIRDRDEYQVGVAGDLIRGKYPGTGQEALDTREARGGDAGCADDAMSCGGQRRSKYRAHTPGADDPDP